MKYSALSGTATCMFRYLASGGFQGLDPPPLVATILWNIYTTKLLKFSGCGSEVELILVNETCLFPNIPIRGRGHSQKNRVEVCRPLPKTFTKVEIFPTLFTGSVHFFVSRIEDFFQTTFFIFQTQVTVRFFIAQLKRERFKP